MRLLDVDPEFSDVVHVVGTNHALHTPLLALCVDDDGTLGTLEGDVAADGVAITIDEETVRTGYQQIVGIEGACVAITQHLPRVFFTGNDDKAATLDVEHIVVVGTSNDA